MLIKSWNSNKVIIFAQKKGLVVQIAVRWCVVGNMRYAKLKLTFPFEKRSKNALKIRECKGKAAKANSLVLALTAHYRIPKWNDAVHYSKSSSISNKKRQALALNKRFLNSHVYYWFLNC